MIRRWILGWKVIRRAYWSWKDLMLGWQCELTIAFFRDAFWEELNGDLFPPIK